MRIFSDARRMVPASAVYATFGALRTFAAISIVSPPAMGVWNGALALLALLEFARLGVVRGMAILAPRLIGEGKEAEARDLVRDAGAFSLAAGCVAAGAALLGGCFVADPQARLTLWILAPTLLLQQSLAFLRELACVRREFSVRASEAVLAAVVELVGCVILAKLFGLAGLALAMLAGVTIPTSYLLARLRFRLQVRHSERNVRRLVRLGLPLTAADTIFELIRRADLIVIGLILGAEAAGYYGVALLAADLSVQVARYSVASVVTPSMLRAYGIARSLADARPYYAAPTLLCSYTLPPLLGVAALALPAVVEAALPEYSAGATAGQWMLVGSLFVVIHAAVSPFLAAADRISDQIRLIACLLPFAVGLQTLAVHWELGLPGAAGAAGLTLAIVALSEVVLARRAEGDSYGDALGFAATLALAPAAGIVITAAVGLLDFAGVVGPLPSWPLQAALLALFYAPIFLAYEARFRLLPLTRAGKTDGVAGSIR